MSGEESGIWGDMEEVFPPFVIGLPFGGMVSWLVVWVLEIERSLIAFVGLGILFWLIFSLIFAVFFWDGYMVMKYQYLVYLNKARAKLVRFLEWYLPLVIALAISIFITPLALSQSAVQEPLRKIGGFVFFTLFSFMVGYMILAGVGNPFLRRFVRRVFG